MTGRSVTARYVRRLRWRRVRAALMSVRLCESCGLRWAHHRLTVVGEPFYVCDPCSWTPVEFEAFHNTLLGIVKPGRETR